MVWKYLSPKFVVNSFSGILFTCPYSTLLGNLQLLKISNERLK